MDSKFLYVGEYGPKGLVWAEGPGGGMEFLAAIDEHDIKLSTLWYGPLLLCLLLCCGLSFSCLACVLNNVACALQLTTGRLNAPLTT